MGFPPPSISLCTQTYVYTHTHTTHIHTHLEFFMVFNLSCLFLHTSKFQTFLGMSWRKDGMEKRERGMFNLIGAAMGMIPD